MMKHFKNPGPPGLVLIFIIWLISIGYYTEYVINRPTSGWFGLLGFLALGAVTYTMLAMAFNWVKNYFLEDPQLEDPQIEDEESTENENLNQ